VTETGLVNGLKEYGYDTLGRLTSVEIDKTTKKEYLYDDTHGRLSSFNGTTMEYDNRGRLTDFGSTTLTYDNYGNRLTKGTTEYTWTRGHLLDTILGVSEYKYDKNGVVKIYREGLYLKGKTSICRMQKRLRYKEVYNDGFLALRRDSKATQVESFKYNIENLTIDREWRNERFGVLYLGHEQYNEEGKILVQQYSEINLNNSNEIVSDEKYDYFYSNGIISHIISQVRLEDHIQITRLEYQEMDELDNPLVIREYKEEGESALLYIKKYEYAYDAETAKLLQMKFDSLKQNIWDNLLKSNN
jgi:hypothetical protein